MGHSMPREIRFVFISILLVCAQSCSILRDNLRAVEAGQFYRSGQMSGVALDAVTDWYGIKTVVNLRGEHPDEAWYRNEIATCEQNNVVHRDISWSMRRIPTPESLLQLIEWIQTEPRPILVHCQAGVHRAAVASAVFRLLRGDSVEDAREEFGLFFLDAPIGGLLDLYDESKPFEDWAREDYPKIYAEHAEP